MTESIMFSWTDEDGNVYTIDDDNPIDFGDPKLEESKRIMVVLKNVALETEDVVVRAIAHPTDPLGTVHDTIDALLISDDEAGPYAATLTIASLEESEEKEIWLQWTIPDDALPGPCRFALEARGKTILGDPVVP